MFEANKSICHLTSAHPRFDTRIFFKECVSLKRAGYDVSLIVADGLPNQVESGVNIFGVEKPSSRLDRMRNATKRVFRKALEVDADVYHLHDPELMPIGLKLKRKGKKVVFDAHEDLPVQLLNKSYSRKWLLKLLSKVAAIYEAYVCSRIDGVIAATPFIEKKFKRFNPLSVAVNNFPLLSELEYTNERNCSSHDICYVGGISKVRGIFEAVKSLEHCPEETGLIVAGRFETEGLRCQVQELSAWPKVDYVGFVGRREVAEIYQRSIAGLVTLHPIPNYLDALPVKMFEYMGAGIPVVASNIPLWKEIVEGNDCGVVVDPLDPAEIAKAVSFFVSNPDEAERMGRMGRDAVLKKYNWEVEKAKLLKFYEEVVCVR